MINPLTPIKDELLAARQSSEQTIEELSKLREELDLITVQPWGLSEEQL